MMTMTQDKQTPNAIAFTIEMPVTKVAERTPEIKKRLEEQSAPPMLSLEQIEAKLMKAGEKRRLSLHQ